jgi:hypothetical protein
LAILNLINLLNQCAIPVFDGLLPEPHNTHVLRVLFDLAHWHGLAKLHLHTDTTLALFSQVTTSFGNRLRTFKEKTCKMYPTRELEREQAARVRRKSKQQECDRSARQPKQLNLNTYKYHSLGDYVHTIRRFGTTDSYSTQPVSSRRCCVLFVSYEDHQSEREHRTSKARFLRTNGRAIPQQLAGTERWQRHISMIHENLDRRPSQIQPDVITNDPGVQYNMGKSEKSNVHIPTFLQRNQGDPAVKVNNLLFLLAPKLTYIPCRTISQN